jgi:hypothetical protein
MGEREDFLDSEAKKSRGCATIVIEFLYDRTSNENVDSWSSRPFMGKAVSSLELRVHVRRSPWQADI